MITQMPGPISQEYVPQSSDWRPAPYRAAPPRPYSSGPSLLPLLGLAVVGVVVLGGIYLAPDFIRYMKIRNM